MRARDVRSAFLDFFQGHGHTVVPSSSLIPHNDPTLFFVNAGMVQFKDTFTGKEARDYSRAATVQKCLRVSGKHNDLENVGRTPRHHTFFEMLGNFSFGDYFKPQAIPMAWDLLTNRLGIDGERLWVTVFEDDDEAYELWKSIGFPEARLQRLGAKDNFWSMGEFGPCGPCSEIHYDHGADRGPGGGPATESDRYVEIWNLVFMQFEQTPEGRFDLPRPSIDTGAGLERVAAVLQGVYSNYDTDLFAPLLDKAAELAGTPLGRDPEIDTALRVISDHARATAFLVGDGVMPSNEGRGYVLRRVMRRAIRFGVKAGIDDLFFHEVAGRVIEEFGQSYPELAERRTFIDEVVRSEEERFRRTLDRGMKLLDDEISAAGSGGMVGGKAAFKLSDTFGFPLDLQQLIASERGCSVDEDGFNKELEKQKERGRKAWKGSGEEAVGALWADLAQEHGVTGFSGYDKDADVGTVLALVRQTFDAEGGVVDSEHVDRLDAGERGVALLDRTPFYAESGGQVGDTGTLGTSRVVDTSKANGLHLHHVVVAEPLNTGDTVEARVDGAARDKTRRNHTATHLLHSALRNILGDHVTQKGSLVGPNRLRFDFSHHKSMTAEDIRAVEDQVNEEILRNPGLSTELKSLDQAIADGAMALFGEKYDADVRVVTVPGYSVELCGGTHVRATGDIGLFRITGESGIAAGVRRIEAQTGTGAIEVVRGESAALAQAAAALKTSPDRLMESIDKLQKERKELERQIASMKAEAAKAAAGDLLDAAREFGGVKVLAAEYSGDLREQADRLRDQLGSALVVLMAPRGPGKVQILAAATKDVAGSKVHAGKILGAIAPLVGGRGGGRPDMAQGGGKDPAGIPAALEKAWEVAEAALS